MCSYTEPVDGVLIYQHSAQLGHIIGRDMKSRFPTTPVVLVSTGFGMMAPSPDLDAVCYTRSPDDRYEVVGNRNFRARIAPQEILALRHQLLILQRRNQKQCLRLSVAEGVLGVALAYLGGLETVASPCET